MAPAKKKAAPAGAPAATDTGSSFEWAANPAKLKQSLAHVKATQPELKEGSKEHNAAVKERYVALKGLVHGSAAAPAGKRGSKVENLASDDGSAEVEADPESGE